MMDLIAIVGSVIGAGFGSELKQEIQLLMQSKIFGALYTHDFLSNSLESPEIFFFEGDNLMAAEIRSQPNVDIAICFSSRIINLT